MYKKVIDRWQDNWKLAGDLAVILIPIYNQIIEHAPGMSEVWRYWLMSLGDISLALFTFITKMKQNHEIKPEPGNTETEQL